MNRNPAQSVATVVAVVFISVGLLGFIPAVTTHYESMSVAGHGSGAQLLGLFQVSILLNVVHVLFGAVGLGLARTMGGARQFLIGGGVVSLALWLLGMLNAGKWIPVNAADDWLHLGLGVGLIGLGFATNDSLRAETT